MTAVLKLKALNCVSFAEALSLAEPIAQIQPTAIKATEPKG
ncbi:MULTISPECIES: hypothetical protein [Cyanophyceae]|nr:hypothetical protein [Phormidium sp. FACHB-592]